MNRSRALRSSALLAMLSLAALGCGDSGTPPDTGGTYVALLNAPAGAADGAAVLELNGAGIEELTPLDAQLFTERSGNTVRVVLVRAEPGALRFNIRLARGSALPQATVLDVADGNDVSRSSLTGYSVRFSR